MEDMEDVEIKYPSKEGLERARSEFKKQYRKEPPSSLVDLINEAEEEKSEKSTPDRKDDIAAKGGDRNPKDLDP